MSGFVCTNLFLAISLTAGVCAMSGVETILEYGLASIAVFASSGSSYSPITWPYLVSTTLYFLPTIELESVCDPAAVACKASVVSMFAFIMPLHVRGLLPSLVELTLESEVERLAFLYSY